MKKYTVIFAINSRNEFVVQVIKTIRDILKEQGTGGLLEAKHFYHAAKVKPTMIAHKITKKEAIKIAETLKEYANVEICETIKTYSIA